MNYSTTPILQKALSSITVLFCALGYTSTYAATSAEQATLTDSDIAAIVVAANNADIDAGKLSKSKTQNKQVQTLAKQMITDHTAVNNETAALAKKLKVKPTPNETSQALKTKADQTLSQLKKLDGSEFDKAYVDNEVAYHQEVLNSIDNTLIPNAKNPELKRFLEKVRPSIAQHLDHAKHLQQNLEKNTSS